MQIFRKIGIRLRSLFRLGQRQSELDEEIQSHLDLRVEELIAQGATHADACCQARREFGRVDSAKEATRDSWGVRAITDTFRDIRFAGRSLRKSPGFVAVVLVTLGLGIGANTAMFSVFHAVLMRPLPYHDPEQLVAVWENHIEGSGRSFVSSGNYLDWVEQNTVFEEMGAWAPVGAGLIVDGVPAMAAGARATTSMFRTLGVSPLMGRGFFEGPNAESTGREILISHAVWQSRFGGRNDVIGEQVFLDDTPMTVIGVMPASFAFPSRNCQFWLALRFDAGDRDSRKTHAWRVVARLKANTTVEAARAEMDGLTARGIQAHPQFMAGWSVRVVPYHADLVRGVRPIILVLFFVVAAVLLVACTNASNLMLLRTVSRMREFAIRSALGGGKGRISRQLLVEAVLLSALGAGLGLLLAAWMVRDLAFFAPGQLLAFGSIGLNQPALVASLMATVLALAAIGLLPFWRLNRAGLHSALRGGRGASGGVDQRRMRHGLVIGQMAFATMLLIGAGLLLRSLERLQRVEPGFDPDNLLVASVNLPRTRYQNTDEQARFFDGLKYRVESIAGVTAVAASAEPPLANAGTFSFVIDGRVRTGPNPRENPVELRAVTPGYFQVMRIPRLLGRTFDERDSAGRPSVAIVNRAFARMHFPREEAMGQRISFQGHAGPWIEIVGQVEDVKDDGLDSAAAPAIYVPYVQKPWAWMSSLNLMVRTAGDPVTVGAGVREALAAADGLLPVRTLSAMQSLYENRNADRRFALLLLGGFAVLALTLGLIGIYGVIAFSVSQRTRELGIRSALGADRRQLMAMVLKEGIMLGAAGALCGVAGAFAMSRFLRGLLFEISPLDPSVFFIVAVVLLVACLVTLYPLARRAGKTNPMAALRFE